MTKRRVAKRLALVLAGVVVALVIAEIVCRIDKLFPGQPFSSASAHTSFKASEEAGSGRELQAFAPADPQGKDTSLHLFAHPFDGWADPRSTGQFEELTRWYADPQSAKTFDILIIGGSVSAVFGNLSTRRLITTLRQHPRLLRRGIRVWNMGNAAFKEPQPLHLFESMLAAGHRPDAVVLIDGFNEVAISAENVERHVHPLYPAAGMWGPIVLETGFDPVALNLLGDMRTAQKEEQSVALTALARGYEHSALLTRITLARLSRQRHAFEAARDEYVDYGSKQDRGLVARGPAFEGGVDDGIAVGVEAWSQSAALVHALCVDHAIMEVHVMQPSLADTGSKVPTEAEKDSLAFNPAWRSYVQRGYPPLRAAAEKLRVKGIPIDDATRLFEHESATVYIDLCHLTDPGNDQLCSFVLKLIDQRLE